MNSNTVAALIKREKTGEDEYGNDVYGEVATVLPGIWWPGGTSERLDGQDQVVTEPTVCLPTGTSAAAVDAVVPQVLVDGAGAPILDENSNVQGDRYEINGDPTAWPVTPWGWQPPFSVVIQLRRVA